MPRKRDRIVEKVCKINIIEKREYEMINRQIK